MQYNVATLLKEPVGSTRQYEIEPEPPVHRGSVQFVRTPGAILVRAEADVIIEATCSRCLAPFGYPAHVAFEEEFFQPADLVTGARLEHEIVDADSFWIEENHIIDISEALRQYSETAAEMQPLCRPDCPGLCSQCGRELGAAECTCDTSTIDPRMLALAALKQSRDGQ